MKIETAIANAKKKLIAKASKSGLYENFGEKEIRSIEDKYIDISCYTGEMNNRRLALSLFFDWCMNYCG